MDSPALPKRRAKIDEGQKRAFLHKPKAHEAGFVRLWFVFMKVDGCFANGCLTHGGRDVFCQPLRQFVGRAELKHGFAQCSELRERQRLNGCERFAVERAETLCQIA